MYLIAVLNAVYVEIGGTWGGGTGVEVRKPEVKHVTECSHTTEAEIFKLLPPCFIILKGRQYRPHTVILKIQ
jgi:hypothetical protein